MIANLDDTYIVKTIKKGRLKLFYKRIPDKAQQAAQMVDLRLEHFIAIGDDDDEVDKEKKLPLLGNGLGAFENIHFDKEIENSIFILNGPYVSRSIENKRQENEENDTWYQQSIFISLVYSLIDRDQKKDDDESWL